MDITKKVCALKINTIKGGKKHRIYTNKYIKYYMVIDAMRKNEAG